VNLVTKFIRNKVKSRRKVPWVALHVCFKGLSQIPIEYYCSHSAHVNSQITVPHWYIHSYED